MFSKKLKDLASKVSKEAPGIGKKLTDLAKDGPSMEGMVDAVFGSDAQEPDWNEKSFPPLVEFRSLLTDLTIKAETGLFRIGTLKCYHLPEKDTSGKPLEYDPSTTQINKLLLRTDLHPKGADKLLSFYLCATGIHKVVSQVIPYNGPESKFPREVKLTDPGEYELKFYLANKHFYTHSFEIIKTPADDPYSPVEAIYSIGGWWEKLALLQYRYDDQVDEFKLSFYPILNYKGIHVRTDRQLLMNRGTAQMKCVLKKGSQLLGSVVVEENSDKDDVFGDPHVPAFFDYHLSVDHLLPAEMNSLSFVKLPKTNDSMEGWVKTGELDDGTYTIEMSMKDMADREDFTAAYTFKIKEKQFIPFDQSDRTKHADPTTILEPGREFIIISSNT